MPKLKVNDYHRHVVAEFNARGGVAHIYPRKLTIAINGKLQVPLREGIATIEKWLTDQR